MYQPIASTREFGDALIAIQIDVVAWMKNSGRKTSVRLPKPLVDSINSRGDIAYDTVQSRFKENLAQFCPIGNWQRGKDEKGNDYIQFDLLPQYPKEFVA